MPLSPDQGEEGGLGHESSLILFLMHPGKQLCAIQITCQSDCDEGSFRSLNQSACLEHPVQLSDSVFSFSSLLHFNAC